MLRIYNTLSKRKEIFRPQQKNQVNIYICGSTVYDSCHLGHARVAVNMDVLVRHFRQRGYDVNYVRNITDIDDKIINRAAEERLPYEAISAKYTQEMHEDYRALGLDPPTTEPCATAYIDDIKEFILRLEKNGYIYKTADGDICYRVRKFSGYGKLSGKKIDELRSGARVAMDKSKEDPLDFVLWKAAKAGEPSWNSPWGDGRPGWHIECSAMSASCLGCTLDIHGGGSDLIFPHHENEIAQSEAAHGVPLANYWLHCGPLTIHGKKMAKSRQNFVTIQELLTEYDAEVIKYFIHTGHYRSPLDFSHALMRQAKAALERLYGALKVPVTPDVATKNSPFEQDFLAALDNDLNTPEALASLFSMAKAIQSKKDAASARSLRKCGRLLGLFRKDDYLREIPPDEEKEKEVIRIIKQREAARAAEEWTQADLLRKKLDEMGIRIQDTPQGTNWRKKL